MYSVVITTKDRPDYLIRCLKSISKSSCLPNDVIVINDGGKPIEESSFSLVSINLKIINHSESKGANYCRNLGVSESEKEIVFFLDDDDAVLESSFESRLKLFELSPNIGLVYTGIQIVKSSQLTIVTRTVEPKSSEDYERDLLLIGNVVGSTSRVGVRKSFFYQVNGFDESLPCMQDYDLWIRMASVCEFRHDGKAGILYTIHDDGQQISSKYHKYLLAGTYLQSKYSELFEKHKASRNFKSRLFYKVASSAAPISFKDKIYFALKSFITKPNAKSFVLILMPFYLLRKLVSII